MRNASCLGICWAMTLGLVAVALGQQPGTTPQSADSGATNNRYDRLAD